MRDLRSVLKTPAIALGLALSVIVATLVPPIAHTYFASYDQPSHVSPAQRILTARPATFGATNGIAPRSMFRHLLTSEGLSDPNVLCMMQDSRGFIWIGSQNGLDKYDGYKFRSYHAIPFDSTGLLNNIVTCICEDSSHAIWVGTRGGGLNRIDRKTDKIEHFLNNPNDTTSISSDLVVAIFTAPDGKLWIDTHASGINVYDPATGRFKHFAMPGHVHTIGDANVFLMLSDTGWSTSRELAQRSRPVRFMLNSGNSLSSYDSATRQATLLTESGVGSRLMLFASFSEDPGQLLVSTSDRSSFTRISSMSTRTLGTSEVVTSTKTPLDVRFILRRNVNSRDDSDESNQDALRLRRAQYVVGTSTGLFILDARTHTLERYVFESEDAINISADYIACGFFDKSGRLWLGTRDGIYVSNENASTFERHPLLGTDKGKKPRNQTVRSLHCNTDGVLRAGTFSGGLFQWSAADRSFVETRVVHSSLNASLTASINSMADDAHGRLWLAISNGPCVIYPHDGERPTPLFVYGSRSPGLPGKPPESQPQVFGSDVEDPLSPIARIVPNPTLGIDTVRNDLPTCTSGYGIYCDRDETIWLGTGGLEPRADIPTATIFKYDTRTRIMRTYSPPVPNSNSRAIPIVLSVTQDRAGVLWFAISEGLLSFDKQQEKFTTYGYSISDTTGLNCKSVWVLFEDSRGNFWVGTWGGGLNLLDRATGHFTHFTSADGLPSNNIQSILESKDGTLWIATSNGISHFDPIHKSFSNYSSIDGLLDNEFQPNAAAVLPSGEMFFGGLNGITSFFPERVTAHVTAAPLFVTSVSILNKPRYRELTGGDTIAVDYDENDMGFEFASLDFASPAKKRYAYMLDGQDRNWVQCGNRNTGAYGNIKPGRYVLRIKACNAQGTWDERGIALVVLVRPPFWGTWWFQIALGLCVASVLAGVAVRRQARQRALRMHLDEARENERINLAAELHDGPLQDLYATRFLLDATTGKAVDGKEEDKPQRTAMVELDSLLQKVRGDLRSITGELRMPRFEHGLAEAIAAFAGQFQDHHPELDVVVDVEEPDLLLDLRVIQNIFRIFRSALLNIERHANATDVSLQLHTQKRAIVLTIRDNGRGFAVPSDWTEMAEGRHYGLLLMQNYAVSIGAKMTIESVIGEGTKIEVNYEQSRRRTFSSYFSSLAARKG